MIGEVVDADVGELLDGPHEQRRAAHAVRGTDLSRAVVGDGHPGVARDRDHRGAGGGRIQVDVDAGQREHGVAALAGGLAGVGAHDEEADAVGDRCRAFGVVEAAEHVRHARDVAGQLLDGEEDRGAGEEDDEDRTQREREQGPWDPALVGRLGRRRFRYLDRRRRAVG